MTPGQFAQSLHHEVRQYILPYWMFKACDIVNGGYWGSIDNNGEVNRLAAKGSILHCRILWAFSAAYGTFGDPALAEHARRSHHYIQQHLLLPNGNIGWHHKRLDGFTNHTEQCISQAYWLYGQSELACQLGNTDAIKACQQSWQRLEQLIGHKALNSPESETGYTWRTWLHIIEAMDRYVRLNPIDETRQQLCHLLTFSLTVLTDYRSLKLSVPHLCASAWLLLKWIEHWLPERLDMARKLACEMVDYANATGLNNDGGYRFSQQDDNQYGWVQAEAMLANWRCFQASGNQQYWQNLIQTWHFINEHISDHVFGEWHWQRRTSGLDEKAGFWKCPYHNTRACLEIYHDIAPMGTEQWNCYQ